MPRRDPAKAVQTLNAMLEYFDGGRRWMRLRLRDASGQHRCLIGTLHHVRRQERIRGCGTEFYLRAALLSLHDDPLDPLIERVMARSSGELDSGYDDLMSYNDDDLSYDHVRTLIVEARTLAQAELDAARDSERRDRRTPTTSANRVADARAALSKIVSTNR